MLDMLTIYANIGHDCHFSVHARRIFSGSAVTIVPVSFGRSSCHSESCFLAALRSRQSGPHHPARAREHSRPSRAQTRISDVDAQGSAHAQS